MVTRSTVAAIMVHILHERSCERNFLSHGDGPRSSSKKRRSEEATKTSKPAGARRASRERGMASTVTRFARLGTRESQIQTARDRMRLGSVILAFPVAGRKAGGGGRETTASY